jgi:uncharacterized protein YjbJ (UPF0337 family)
MQEAYGRADEITAEVREREEAEQKRVEWETEKMLKML